MSYSRRAVLRAAAAAAPALWMHRTGALAMGQTSVPSSMPANLPPKPTFADAARTIADGPFRGDWDSLKGYKTPDWFRDAKFGIWAHWSAQCVPEQGDWY